mmetsp:Transcript_69137/g.193218  ORF Transcript_69137/g.193218 Transcript_69137/m.193218 type:complete len:214 (-) Transcript_69137:218-859(-)
MPWAVTTMAPTCSSSDSESSSPWYPHVPLLVVISPVVSFSEVRSLTVDDDETKLLSCERLARPGSKVSRPMMSRWHGAVSTSCGKAVVAESGLILMAVIDRSTSLGTPLLSGVTRCRVTFGAVVTAACSATVGCSAASSSAPVSLMISSSALTVLCCVSTEGNRSSSMGVPCAGVKLDIALAIPLLHSTTRSSWSSTTSCALLLCHACARRSG